jgi:hypothetical protein
MKYPGGIMKYPGGIMKYPGGIIMSRQVSLAEALPPCRLDRRIGIFRQDLVRTLNRVLHNPV